ncbi:MAG: methyltransferase domain-containing protein [Pseudomonadota bacterium]
MKKAIRDAMIAKVAGDPLGQVRLARALARDAYRAAAYRLVADATAAAPGDREVRRIAAEVLSQCVGDSFFDVVRNEVRNAAHDKAIRRAIRPGMRVLEIGTGAGVFAMMAARAGAEVVTCDMSTAMADTARAIIAHNGLSDRIRVINSHSTSLTAADIGGPADLLISEVILLSLLDKRGREVMRHAAEQLLTPEAPMIPARATVCVALAEDADLPGFRAGASAGFDLSPLNRLAPPAYITRHDGRGIMLRSAAGHVFTQDFDPRRGPAPSEGGVLLTAAGGRADGIVQWALLALDESTRYENVPGTPAQIGWEPVFFPFERPRDFAPGTQVAVRARQEGNRLHVWSEDAY